MHKIDKYMKRTPSYDHISKVIYAIKYLNFVDNFMPLVLYLQIVTMCSLLNINAVNALSTTFNSQDNKVLILLLLLLKTAKRLLLYGLIFYTVHGVM